MLVKKKYNAYFSFLFIKHFFDIRVFDKKKEKRGKRRGKEKINNKTNISSSLPHLFLISAPSLPSFIIGNKKEFSNRLFRY